MLLGTKLIVNQADCKSSLYLIILNLFVSCQSGCARFIGNFVFNRKRNVVELEIRQDTTSKEALKYVVCDFSF